MSHLDEAYLDWLYRKVVSPAVEVEHSGASFRDLLKELYRKPFVAFIQGDDSRIGDGMDVRTEFLHEHRETGHLNQGCSVLEVIVGLSRRLEFMQGGDAPSWAWQLIVNLDLHNMRDPLRRYKINQIYETLEMLVWRQYAPDGMGGLFPLAWPKEDQRHVELWYQMAAYIDEMHDP